jgi:DNA-binding beta-propeller fold protein YncE
MKPLPQKCFWTAIAAGALMLGCATPVTRDPGAVVSRVWPPPPAQPRVAYVRTIASPADLGVRVSWWSALGNALTGGQRGREAFVKPFGLALDEAGNLCVTDTGAPAVVCFNQARKTCRRWTAIGPVKFVVPVAVAKQDGVIYVADTGLPAVVAFRESGEFLFQIKDRLERPAGLAIGGERLFVADAGAHRVVVFDLQGRYLSQFGQRGREEGQFNFPTHLATTGAGRLLVTDSMNSRVQLFDTAGEFLGVIGSLGDGSGHFSRPKGVAVDQFGHVYVVDTLFDNIQIFDEAGRFLLDVGGAGPGPGQFWMPAGLAISRDNQIYVADTYNQRVQVLRYVGDGT